ncbi:CPBP family intramembrane metalloprotease [Candidatus Micrarchaeota archaeon]|nr:CPBP family intramembrane metalloprotease [Candidatus Micrarchaeota archaeon]
MAVENRILNAIAISLFFFFIPFLFLKYKKKLNLNKSLAYLSLKKSAFFPLKNLFRTISDSIVLFITLIAITFVLAFVLMLFGFYDLQKVATIIQTLPPSVLFIAIFISPITEEIFFRGFLQKRFGLIASTAIFGFSHMFYGSISEILGALLLGAFLGIYVEKKKNLFPAIFAHVAYNALSVATALMGVGQ